jgi:hypothetical protein
MLKDSLVKTSGLWRPKEPPAHGEIFAIAFR